MENKDHVPDTTPTKENPFDCCFCLSSGISVKFNFNGKKCSDYDFSSKLKLVFGSDSFDLIDELFQNEASVCRNWFSSFSRLFGFISSSKHCFSTFLYQKTQKKRMTNFSPEICHDFG